MRYVNANKIAYKARLSTLNIGASLILLLNSFAAASPLFLTGKAFAAPSLPSVPVQTLPVNGANLTDGNVTLAWDASTGGSGTLFYTVAVATSSATNADGSFSSSTGGTTTTSLSYTPSGTLAAGTYYWNIEACNDNSGSHCSAWSTPESFTIAAADTTGPAIGTTTPTDHEVISKNGSYTVSAVVSDPSGVQGVSYSANTPGVCLPIPFYVCIIQPESFSGTLTDPDHDGTYTTMLDTTTYGRLFSFPFSALYTFTFTATDDAAAHNSTTKTVSGVTFSTPVSTASVTGQDFDTWDNSPAFKGINVGFETADFNQINSITVTLQKNGSDIVTNTASAAMLNDINTQQDGFTQDGSLSTPFVVSGTLNDTYCQGGPCWDAGAHTWQTTEQPDTAVVTVTGTDASGSVTKIATLTNFTEPNGVTFADLFPADTTPPSVPQLASPVDRGYTNTNDFYFKWDPSTDDNPGVTYEFQSSQNPHTTNGVLDTGVWDNIADGAPDRNNLTDPQIHSYGAPDGVWYWQVRAIDAAGNKSAWTNVWHVTIDTHAPTTTLNVEHLANGYVNSRQNGDKLTITGSASDNLGLNRVLVQLLTSKHGAIQNHTVYLSGTSQDWSTDYDVKSLGLADGAYSVVATVVDNAGNTYKTSYLDYTLDNTKPVATFTSNTSNPTPNGIYNQDFTVGYEVSDNYMLKSVGVSLFDTDPSHSNHWATGCYSNGNETVSDDSGTCTVKLGSLPDGKYYVAVQGQDAAGLWTVAATRYITIDRTGPAVTITSPSNGALISAANGYTVSGTVDDSDVSGVSRVVVYVKDLTDSTQSKTMQATVTGGTWNLDLDSSLLPDGHQVRIIAYAKDGLNNTGATTHADVTLDNTGPELVYNGKTVNSNVITPNYTATDAHGSTPLTFAWTADAGNPTGATISDVTALNPDFTVTSSGDYTFTLTASDSLGNATTSTFSFTYAQPSGGNSGGFTNTGGTAGQPAITANTLALAVTPQVLGDSTTTTSTPNNNGGSSGKVKGDSTANPQSNSSEKTASGNFLGLGWWWLLIVAIVGGLWFAFFRRRDQES